MLAGKQHEVKNLSACTNIVIHTHNVGTCVHTGSRGNIARASSIKHSKTGTHTPNLEHVQSCINIRNKQSAAIAIEHV